MKPLIDKNIYFAKATFPHGNTWRGAWTTKDEAEKQATRFVDQWKECGISAKAAVFYRDGNMVCEKGNL